MTPQLLCYAEYHEADARIHLLLNSVYLCVSNNSTFHSSPIIIMTFVQLLFFLPPLLPLLLLLLLILFLVLHLDGFAVFRSKTAIL
jgi:hypothetical protein